MRIDYSTEGATPIININDINDNHFVCAEYYGSDGEIAYQLTITDRGYGFVGLRSLNIDDMRYFNTLQEAIIDFIDVPEYETATVHVFNAIKEVQGWFYNLKFPEK
jgi:hypothetical protein